jgi:GlpG protein
VTPVTGVFAAIAIGAHALMFIDPDRWDFPGYREADAIWDGDYWALLWSTFLHGDLLHLGFNLWWIVDLGRALERHLGAWKYAVFFLASAAVSAALQFGASGDAGIGLSGVVYALAGYLWAGRPVHEEFRKALGRNEVTWLVLWGVFCIATTRMGYMNIANTAHFGGLAFGFAAGLAFEFPAPRRVLGTATVVVLTIASVVPLFWAPWLEPWVSHQALSAHDAERYEDAERLYRRALDMGAEPAWIYYNLAVLGLNRDDEALYEKALNSLREVDPAEAGRLEESLKDD